jgi:hypothetical protein
MPIDFATETLLTFSEAAAILPGRPHVSTFHRWRLRGVHGIKLSTYLVGGRRYTTRRDLEVFVAATTAAAEGEAPPARTSRQHMRAVEAAERQLRAARI